jgi:hypothetical protein
MAVFALSVRSASAVPSERANGTLEPLLVTPMLASDIIKQKMRGVRRLARVLLVPFLTLYVLNGLSAFGRPRGLPALYPFEGGGIAAFAVYVGASLVTTVLYLAAFSWLSLWMGLRSRTRLRAIVGALAAIVVWNVGPPLVGALTLIPFGIAGGIFVGLLGLLSPATGIALTASPPIMTAYSLMLVLPLTLLGNALVFVYFRRKCLSRADTYLGRVEPGVGHRDPAARFDHGGFTG